MPEANRVLQVVTDTDRRGAQVFATDLHQALTRMGRAVRTVALAPGTVGGLDLPVLGTRRIGVTSLRALRGEARRCGVVIAHGSSTLPASAMALAGTGVPFVYRQISDSMFWASTPLRRARVRMGLRRAAAIVALWAGAAETLSARLAVPRSKIHLVPNGVPPDRFEPATPAERQVARHTLGLDDRPVVAYVGALAREKGVDVAIEAIGQMPTTQLLVAGDGPERAALDALAGGRASGRVVFSGSLSDARIAYAAADVVVLASRGGDSMPAALIEAGFMGVPAVATPVEGIPDIVLDATTGRLVATDDATALRDALTALTRDPELRHRLGAAARDRCIARFGIDTVAAQWAAVIDGVSGGTGRG